jgi:acyl-CoA synthetase (AMP-forming)/AMP-acid ligase II
LIYKANTLAEILLAPASNERDRVALVLPGERRTYRQLLDGSRVVARGLWALGVRPRQNVGVLIPNSIEFVEALFGIALLGAVPVPINARYRVSEIAHVVRNGDLVALLTSDIVEDRVDFAHLLAEALAGLAEADDPGDVRLEGAAHLRSAVMLRGTGRPGLLGRSRFEELAEGVADAEVPDARDDVGQEDTALILYTSGTTAAPKGCMISNRAVTRSSRARVEERLDPGPNDVHWSAGPLFHIGSLQALLGCFATGGTYVTDLYWDADRALRMLEDEGVTHAWPWFPAVAQGLIDHPDFDPDRLRAVRALMLTWPKPLLLRVQELLPWVELFAACGMTETCGVYAFSAKEDGPEERASSGGTALSDIEVRIADPDTGAELPADAIGELRVRGYCVMSGYYRDPEKTAASLDADGWLRTQDLYSRSATDRLTFHGRLKDMLKVGGENVAAVEIESLLSEHPAVKIAEVVGAPDPRLDEVPVAFVELRPGADAAPHELVEHCRGRIASFKVPRAVHFVAPGAWPMSATKVDKGALRASLAKNQRGC